jgi:hypothetical protein
MLIYKSAKSALSTLEPFTFEERNDHYNEKNKYCTSNSAPVNADIMQFRFFFQTIYFRLFV